MKPIWAFFRFCWRVLNFIRDLVMNVIFLLFVLLLAAVVSLSIGNRQKVELVGDQVAFAACFREGLP